MNYKNIFKMRVSLYTLMLLSLMISVGLSQDFMSSWGNGYKLTSSDGDHNLKFGGRIMYDFVAWDNDSDSLGSFLGTEFRRIRFFHSGTVYGNVNYKLQIDFAGGGVSLKDVYIETAIPYLGNLRVGHFKEPFRLEALTSSKYITFLERALPIAFSPERNAGLMIHNSFIDDRLSVQVGLFAEATDGNNKNIDNVWNRMGRLTFVPMKDASKLLHLGVSMSDRLSADSTFSFSTRAENHLGNKLLDLEMSGIHNMNLIGTEMAFVMGSFSIQGEYLMTSLDKDGDGVWNGSHNDNLSSYYGQLSYFLTGETRNYKNSLSGFGRVKPNKNMKKGEGWGALELAARYSSMDLSDSHSGELNDITLGLNWYLNPCTRLMFNYVMGSVTHHDMENPEKENVFQARIQIDF